MALATHLQAELGTASDFLEGYELMAFGFSQPSAGDIVIAGAVHGGIYRQLLEASEVSFSICWTVP